MAIKLVSALSTPQFIQFQNSSGTNTGKIETSGDDLIISNSVGNVLFGDLDSNVYIGDGVNNVDIIFEQSGSIRSENGSSATITLGSAGTTLNLYNPQIANGASLTSALTIGTGGSINFLPDTGSIIELDGQTILKRNTFNGGITLGHDDAVIIAGGDTYALLESNISLGAESIFLGAEGGVTIYAFPNNDTSWANRKEFIFSDDTNFYLDGRVYPSNQATNYVDSTRIANWNQAYSWGDHSDGGYLASSSYTASDVLTKIKTVDGSGSGLDADTVDGIQASAFLRSNAADTATGEILFDAGFKSDPIMLSGSQNFDNISRSGFYNLYATNNGSTNSPGFDYGTMIVVGNNKQASGFGFQLAHERLNSAGKFRVRGMNDSGSAWSSWATVWTSLDFANNSSNWNTAYGWGNHGSAGYLTTASAASTYAPKASPALTGTPTAPTASAATNNTQIATTAFVKTAVSNLVDSAPGALDTLNELAAALGDDANFSTTMTNSIATKLPLAGGTMTGGLTIDYAAGANPLLSLFNDTNGSGAKINFSDQSTPSQNGTLMYVHSDGNSYGTGNAFVFSGTEPTMNVVALGNLMYRDGIYKTPSSGTGAGTRKDANWDTAYGWGNHASAGYLTAHPSISSASSVNNSGRTYIQDITVDSNGHVTAINSATETVVNTDTVTSVGVSGSESTGTITLTAAGSTTLSQSGQTIEIRSTDTNTVYTHPTFNGDDFSIDTGVLTGATVISDLDINITTNGEGHVTDANATVATRNLTLANLGYTGATNANYITNNNQLTNGANYITASSNITGNAATATTAGKLYGNGSIGTQPGTNNLLYTGQISNGTTGLFPASNNANSIITFNKHSGNYDSQLGFSSNGNIYYRNFSNTTDFTTKAWTQVWHSGNFNQTAINNWTTAYNWGNHASAGYSTATGVANNADNYGSWNLKTNDVQRTTVASGGDLNLVAGTNVSLSYAAGGTVTIASTDTNTQLTDAQVRSKISGTGLISYNSSTGVISTTANNYSLPAGSSTTRGGFKIGYAENGKNYPVEVTSEKMYVNVPWTDTNTDTITSVGISGSETAGTVTLTGAGATTITQSGGAIEIRSTDTNTTYTVGDGGLTQKNFTTTLKTKLDGIEAGANNYVHPTTAGNKHIPAGGSAGQFLKYSASGTAVWAADNNTTYTVGDGGLTQKNFTSTLKTKLDGIATGANNYSLPTASASTLGGVKVGTNLSIASGVLSATNTTYSAGTGLTLSGTTFKLKGGEIPASADLNHSSYRATGIYSQNSNSDAASGSNYPVPLAGMLEVWNDDYGNGLHCLQRYSQYNSTDVFQRNYYNGGWSAWRNLTQDNNTTYSVGDNGLTQKNFTSTLKTKLDGIAAGAEVNVQSDWNATSGDSFIQNKPTIPSGNAIIDWTADQGSTNIHPGNYTNTTYSVGDGGLTQKNFTTTLKTKLDGIAAGATNVTNNNQLTNGAGYVTSSGVTSVTVGTGLDVTTGATPNITLDLSEFTDMTAAMVGSDEFIVLDSGAERRKAANEINLSIFNNDLSYLPDVTPVAPVVSATNIVGETIEVVFGESPTPGIDYYQVWSSVDGGSYGLIAQIPDTDFAPVMTVIDASFSISGTISYRVYAVKSGVYSSPGTASKAFTAPNLDVLNMSVISLNTAYYIQYDLPDSRFIDHIEIYMDSEAVQGNLSRTGATLVYSGENPSYMHSVGVTDNYHQFWVEVVKS